jgi:competence protein ComEA
MIKQLFAVLLLTLSSLSFAADTININTVDADTIAVTMKGVGEAKAAAIVAYRNDHGAFKSVDDLVLVKGIGEKTVEMNRDVITVGSAE